MKINILSSLCRLWFIICYVDISYYCCVRLCYYQGLEIKAFTYFYELTYNVAECYRSVCQVITCTIKKFENAFFWLFDQFFYILIVFSWKVVFDRIKNKNNSYLRCHVVRRRPRHRCRVNKDIPTLKIELNIKRPNDQKQKEQFTCYFSKKSLRKSLSLKSEDLFLFCFFS
jgi:hypothetical protein